MNLVVSSGKTTHIKKLYEKVSGQIITVSKQVAVELEKAITFGSLFINYEFDNTEINSLIIDGAFLVHPGDSFQIANIQRDAIWDRTDEVIPSVFHLVSPVYEKLIMSNKVKKSMTTYRLIFDLYKEEKHELIALLGKDRIHRYLI
ncbi:hypothetical protein A3Q56_03727 [Intoshia linei]|uniref:Uncharacterized protein n=1 Tax=Intoshia linei TaxID=1819745 RepID=A0A177B2Q8_9BILA|nr:hypothetical protein A3Q56_03727 [Intoshia linei]